VRADKLCLAALNATFLHYLKDEAELEIPIWRMIAATPEEIRKRAETWAAALGFGQVISGQSTVGGGSLPAEILPTFLLAIETARPARLQARLRQTRPAIIARVEDACAVFDPRTVLAEQEDDLLAGIRAAMEKQ